MKKENIRIKLSILADNGYLDIETYNIARNKIENISKVVSEINNRDKEKIQNKNTRRKESNKSKGFGINFFEKILLQYDVIRVIKNQ